MKQLGIFCVFTLGAKSPSIFPEGSLIFLQKSRRFRETLYTVYYVQIQVTPVVCPVVSIIQPSIIIIIINTYSKHEDPRAAIEARPTRTGVQHNYC